MDVAARQGSSARLASGVAIPSAVFVAGLAATFPARPAHARRRTGRRRRGPPTRLRARRGLDSVEAQERWSGCLPLDHGAWPVVGSRRPTSPVIVEGESLVLSYRDRVRGCLLGGALGDALGAGIEFHALEEIRRAHGPAGVTGLTDAYGVFAPITDDTQMTLFTAEGLIRASVRGRSRGICHPPSVLWQAYQRWLVTQRQSKPPAEVSGWLAAQPVLYARRAPGNACLSGLAQPKMGTPDNPANPDSKGCGAVMRSAPFGLLRREPEDAWSLAVECAVLTHGHPSGYLAAGAFAWVVAQVLDGASVLEGARSALRRVEEEPRGGEVAAALRAALDAAGGAAADESRADVGAAPDLLARRVAGLGEGWVAEEALAIAVFCAGAGADPRPAALLAAVNHSGDSDSTGAICGNLVGAAVGEPGLPAEWVEELEGYDVVREVADDLVREITGSAEVADRWGGATTEWAARYPGG
ncbi:ADP-ribosylglycohydrolase family protein [Frankia sp. CNm7]|uniref:ADP-ribosylglycohydrolase family protein n=1 Tax=Frankia nepalensis TaxID=1836974 RepID=UPI001931FE0C|nr:ADP-ribosylglycohydrolase family protein [Frankia nepalensis]MBL7523075.1 ADP-ribosylglycohydrolase family protein [Frankia nepalensis]